MKNTNIFCTLVFSIIILVCSSCSDENIEIDLDIEAEEIEETEEPDNNDDDDKLEFNLLFIGNSLTYVNDLPNLVKTYAANKGKTLSVTTIAYGNYALIDHWNDGVMQTSIESQTFDFVIVQQGPSSQPYGRGLLIEYGYYISQLCNSNNTKLAYFMVWPSRTYYHTFDGVIESYRIAAQANNDILCPVGEVWKSHFDATGDFSYYGGDGFHPSLEGSTVAAQVIYESLFND